MAASHRPLRVLFLARRLGFGGSERQLVTLAAALRRHGHDVSVAVFYAGGELDPELRSAGVPIHDLRKGGRWSVGGFAARLLSTVRSVDPDVLHSYLDVPNTLAVLTRLGVSRPRIVWGIRNAGMDWRPYGWLPVLMSRVESAVARGAHLVISNSLAGREQWLNRGLPAARVVWIPNGIDCERFRPEADAGRRARAAWGFSDRRVVGIVARLDPVKDHATMLRAMALVAQKVPDAALVCVGGGERPLLDRMRALASELGIADGVRWVPSGDDLAASYNGFDVCALSSTAEGFPNVLGEAMACGTPCVATRVGDAERILGPLGTLVTPRDPAALADALVQSLSMSTEARATTSARARKRILDSFSIELLARRTSSALQAVVAGATPPTDAAGLVTYAEG